MGRCEIEEPCVCISGECTQVQQRKKPKNTEYRVVCQNCGRRGPWSSTESEAIKLWGEFTQTIKSAPRRILDPRGDDILDIFRESFGMDQPSEIYVMFATALRELSFRLKEIETTLEDIQWGNE